MKTLSIIALTFLLWIQPVLAIGNKCVSFEKFEETMKELRFAKIFILKNQKVIDNVWIQEKTGVSILVRESNKDICVIDIYDSLLYNNELLRQMLGTSI